MINQKYLRFRAPVNGVTTGGSGYPRSELRERMLKPGTKDTIDASWSSTEGVHTMFIEQAITALPKKKPHVVAGQIHDADDDILAIRLEGTKLFINYTNKDGKKNLKESLTDKYKLGDKFQIEIVVNGGKVKVTYKSSTDTKDPKEFTFDKPGSGLYFKAGAYTQSNKETEDAAYYNADNYGEVEVYALRVTHNPPLT